MKGTGGKVDAMYFAFGDTDVHAIVDGPDNASMTGLSLTVAGTGALAITTTVLLTPEESDHRDFTHNILLRLRSC